MLALYRLRKISDKITAYTTNIYLFKVNNKNTRKKCKICSAALLLTLNIFHFLF